VPTREASCHCGQLRLEVTGEPEWVSICNCLACQRRTGSAFGVQAGFKPDQVQVHGRHHEYTRVSDESDQSAHVFSFCPECGSSVFNTGTNEPDLFVVFVGAFADPTFPPPRESGYDSRRHPWVQLPDSVTAYDPTLWQPVQPLYADGRYAEAAARGNEILEQHPNQAYLLYNVACCESLSGRAADAVAHIARAIELWPGCREMAQGDSDFDPVRDDPAFKQLFAG
jgi:hypothetical protein